MSAFQTSTPLSLLDGIHADPVELRPFETEFSEKIRESMNRLGQELQQLSLRYVLTRVDKHNGLATPPHYHPGSTKNGDNDQGIGPDPVDADESTGGKKDEDGRHTKDDSADDEARSQNDSGEGHDHDGVEGGVGEEGSDGDQQASGDDQDDEDFYDNEENEENEENEDDAADEDDEEDEEDEPDPRFPPRCRTTPPPIPGPADIPSEDGVKGHKLNPNVQPIAWENQAGATLCFPCNRSYGLFHPWFEFRVDHKTGRVIGDCDNHPKGQPEKSKNKEAKQNQYWPYFMKSKAKAKPQQAKKRGKAAKKRAAPASDDSEGSPPAESSKGKGKGAGGSSKSAKKRSKK